jgi:secreted PhoX family phosphatase
MNGEESGPQGRAFGHVVQGLGNSSTWELPYLGRFSWENSVASPYAQDKTIVAGLDDTGGGELYFYVGTKQASGSPIELAGLTGGMLYTMTIDGFANEPALGFSSAPFRLDVVENPLNATADLDGTRLNRPEDGAWDPRPGKENVFYFVTTDSFTGNSRLWQVTFSNITNPTAGGTIKVLIDGAVAGPRMMDNITVDGSGNVIIQEDPGSNLLPGNQSYQAKIWSYNTASQTLTELARFDPALFTTGQSGFITEDEESSGVIEVTNVFAGVEGYDATSFRYFLLDAQVHKNIAATEPELVEMGQLLLMKTPR